MNNPLGVSPSKGNQGTTRGKENIFWPRWESNPRPPDLIYRYSADWATRSDRESRGRFRWWIAAMRKQGHIWMLCRVALWTQMVKQRINIQHSTFICNHEVICLLYQYWDITNVCNFKSHSTDQLTTNWPTDLKSQRCRELEFEYA